MAPVALVAGASRGLGLLLARELGRRGHRLVICARSAGELEIARSHLEADGLTVRTAVCDVSDAEAVEALVDDTERIEGPVAVAIVVAGVIQVGPLASLTRAHFEEALGVMLWGPVHVGLALAGRMRARGHGRIGVITSVGGLVPVPHLLPYSTAKFAAVGFAAGLRDELAGTGVKVTTVAPGLMRTGSHLRAEFTGNQAAEYAWFAPAASLPVVTMDPEHAAVRIVDAVLAGRAYLLLSLLTKIASRVNGLAPTTTAALLGLTSRLLPSGPAPAGTSTIQGYQVEERLKPLPSVLAKAVTILGRRAANRWNQHPVR
ncbi:MAG: 3-oxoacyl-[acyl-carrier protein] reductase [uncultured Friedmanniella sp.]|uniref:3-oxoacyl-[acyl-carrier protein] reductase n=1 Tax=uncultured Friedmanniella sp. TaxID=335381 RepID=A0A6J4KRZ6_9ACTN|nr:MAG: 3-oxoacyl-[acyl-carrier protein] reductase [uncultured Friedmanniella sp.]